MNNAELTITNTQTILTMLKITKMIKYLLLQFMNVADGDIYTKLLAATKISIAVSPFILVWDKLMKWGIQTWKNNKNNFIKFILCTQTKK